MLCMCEEHGVRPVSALVPVFRYCGQARRDTVSLRGTGIYFVRDSAVKTYSEVS